MTKQILSRQRSTTDLCMGSQLIEKKVDRYTAKNGPTTL